MDMDPSYGVTMSTVSANTAYVRDNYGATLG